LFKTAAANQEANNWMVLQEHFQSGLPLDAERHAKMQMSRSSELGDLVKRAVAESTYESPEGVGILEMKLIGMGQSGLAINDPRLRVGIMPSYVGRDPVEPGLGQAFPAGCSCFRRRPSRVKRAINLDGIGLHDHHAIS